MKSENKNAIHNKLNHNICAKRWSSKMTKSIETKAAKAPKATKEVFVSSWLNTVQTSAAMCASKAEQAFTTFEQTKDDDFKRLAQKNATHAKFNSALAEISEKARAVAYTHKLDASAIVEQSRELKKRLISALEAVAASDKNKLDKALLSLLAEIVMSDKSEFTLARIQTMMNHATTTQAQYFKNWGLFLGFATYDKDTKIVSVKRDNALFKKLVALFD